MKRPEFEKRMDEHVIFGIRLQELAGIDIISDGEWRRHHYVEEFTDRVGGFNRSYEESLSSHAKSIVPCGYSISMVIGDDQIILDIH